MKKHLILLLIVLGLAHGAAQAMTTGNTGASQPFSNMQPSLAVTEVLPTVGVYPQRDSGVAMGGTIGFVYAFAGDAAPGGSFVADGQILSLSQYPELASVLLSTYGGDGSTTFALPNLEEAASAGSGTGTGLSPYTLGTAVGSSTVTLTTEQLPAHEHTLPSGAVTGSTGGNQPFTNTQPTLPLTRVIAVEGTQPQPGDGTASAAFIGQIATFAGDYVPSGWMAADGALLPIAQYPALYSIIGTTYGGDGNTTFALPDLRGRISVGANDAHPLGTTFGAETTTLTTAQLPSHDHTLASGASTGTTGDGQSVEGDQPSLALHYLIAVSGIVPSPGASSTFDTDTAVLGQVTEFAGDFAPQGWAFADGSILLTAEHASLFSIIGTAYGGDGYINFALPDLRGRTLIGTSANVTIGTMVGTEQTTLTVANLPTHDHTYTLPSVTPSTMLLLDDNGAGSSLR